MLSPWRYDVPALFRYYRAKRLSNGGQPALSMSNLVEGALNSAARFLLRTRKNL